MIPKRRSKIRQRSNRKSELKKYWDECWAAARLAVIRRDGGKCQVCRSVRVLQADHFISRAHKSTFFDIRNLTCVCSTCNMLKFYNRYNLPYKVAKIVEKREGPKAIEELESKARQVKKWTIEELQSLTVEFNGMYKENK